MPSKITYSRRGPRKGSRSIFKPQGARRVSRRRIYRYIPKIMGGATSDEVNTTARNAALNTSTINNGTIGVDGEGNPIDSSTTNNKNETSKKYLELYNESFNILRKKYSIFPNTLSIICSIILYNFKF